MRHGKKGKKLSRDKNQRRALLRGLAVNLILHEKIRTTEAKAKALRPFIEKLITKSKAIHQEPAKKLAAIRHLSACLPSAARKKIAGEIALRYLKRQGGYTRIVKLAPRSGDGAKMAIIELVK